MTKKYNVVVGIYEVQDGQPDALRYPQRLLASFNDLESAASMRMQLHDPVNRPTDHQLGKQIVEHPIEIVNKDAFPETFWGKGMTIREYFASQVIGPLMASNGVENQLVTSMPKINITDLPQFIVPIAFDIAEEMMAEEQRRQERARES